LFLSLSVDVNEYYALLSNVAMKRKRFPELCSKLLSNTLKIEIDNLVGYIYHVHQWEYYIYSSYTAEYQM